MKLNIEDVAMFFTSAGVVFAMLEDGRRFIVECNLAHLEPLLNPDLFFRINRQYIVNVLFIRSFSTFKSGQLSLELAITGLKEPVVVSQALTPLFRQWIYNL